MVDRRTDELLSYAHEFRRKTEWAQWERMTEAEGHRLTASGRLPPEETGLRPSEVARIGLYSAYPLEDAAKLLSIGEQQLFDATLSGEVEAVPFYSMVMIPVSALDDYATRHSTPTAPPAGGGWQKRPRTRTRSAHPAAQSEQTEVGPREPTIAAGRDTRDARP